MILIIIMIVTTIINLVALIVTIIIGARTLKRQIELRTIKQGAIIRIGKLEEATHGLDHRTTRNTELIAIQLEAALGVKLTDRKEFIKTSILSRNNLTEPPAN